MNNCDNTKDQKLCLGQHRKAPSTVWHKKQGLRSWRPPCNSWPSASETVTFLSNMQKISFHHKSIIEIKWQKLNGSFNSTCNSSSTGKESAFTGSHSAWTVWGGYTGSSPKFRNTATSSKIRILNAPNKLKKIIVCISSPTSGQTYNVSVTV